MTNIVACSQDNLPSRRSRMPVYLAWFHCISVLGGRSVGLPRTFSPTFLSWRDGNLVHLAWFHCISVLGGRSVGLPRTFSPTFLSRRDGNLVHLAWFRCISVPGGRSICPPRMVFQVHRSGWSGKDSHLARFSPTFLPRGDGNLLHLAWFRCISVLGGRSAGLPRTFFLWFLARWSRMPVHPAHFCTLLRTFPHFCSLLHTFAHFCTLLHAFPHFTLNEACCSW